MTQALNDLRAKVAAGEGSTMGFEMLCDLSPDADVLAELAFLGSVDAALSLYEALRPGWRVFGIDQDTPGNWYVTMGPVKSGGRGVAHAGDTMLARAWLLAILDALISEEGHGEN